MDRSQCTLILLSQSFLNSGYCHQEFDVAYQKKKLIVIMMDVEEFDSNGNILKIRKDNALDLSNHPMVSIYLKQYTYLKQSDIMKNWGKLAYHLPHRVCYICHITCVTCITCMSRVECRHTPIFSMESAVSFAPLRPVGFVNIYEVGWACFLWGGPSIPSL